MLSGGNFHGQAVAMALDVLAIALTNLATIAERRIDRLVHPDLNQGLPPFLTRDAGVNSGFMMAQVTAAALASECKVLSHPGERRHDSDRRQQGRRRADGDGRGVEAAARRATTCAHILAIELMCAAQGIDFRAPLRAGPRRGGARTQRVRELVPPLERGPRAQPRHRDDLADAVGDAALRDIGVRTLTSRERRDRPVPRRRRDPRAPRGRDLLQGMAAGGRAADADEQPRSRRGRASGRSGRVRRHREGGAQLGVPSTRSCARCARSDHDETLLVQSGKPVGVFRTHRRRAARAHREQQPRRTLGDVGAFPRARARAG